MYVAEFTLHAKPGHYAEVAALYSAFATDLPSPSSPTPHEPRPTLGPSWTKLPPTRTKPQVTRQTNYVPARDQVAQRHRDCGT
jgi:hypothetical protein